MKVVHINANRGGGAALCAFRISKSLKDRGVESSVIVAGGSPTEQYQVVPRDNDPWSRNKLTRRFKHLLIKLNIWSGYEQLQYKLYKSQNRASTPIFAHIPLSNYRSLSQHPLVKDADIIHLHWVSGFIDYPSFFKEIQKPIVWTMHDKYPALGLMHYSSVFFPLPKQLTSIDNHCRKIKRQAMLQNKQIQLVAISEYMIDLCRQSNVLRGFPIKLIHNGVDTSIFKLSSQNKARTELGLPIFNTDEVKTTIFMICGCDISSRNKGLDRCIEALQMLETKDFLLLCVGPEPKQQIQAKFPIIYTGTISAQEKLALVYSACDYFILASYEETFAQTPLEAMACGRPVISTPCSGAKDLIRPINGIMCDGFLPQDLFSGIKKAMQTCYQEESIRDYIVQNFSYEVIGQEYLNLYNKLLQK